MRRPGCARPALRALVVVTVVAVLPAHGAASAAVGAWPSSSPAPAARVDPALPTTGDRDVRVVVRLRAGAGDVPQQVVRRLGGRVTLALPLVDGFAATLPAAAVPHLAAQPGVAVVSADRSVRVQSDDWGSGAGPLAPRVVRAPEAWSAGATGRGVTVALLDTGVAPSPDLADRIVPVHDDATGTTTDCHDVSGTGTCNDDYGHGTFMAGLVAGDGTGAGTPPTGTAPRARVLSVKVAGPDGASDVSTVLAALQWVVSFRDRYDIRVLNLSLGTDSTQSWHEDPLNYAVERAWAAGIFVVVAASNTGPAPGTVAKPGDDPWVVTVGAVDDRGTRGLGDDTVPNFTSRGPTADGVAKPDVVAPGAHVVSLRVPGSTLDTAFPPADPSSPYRTGSGTSMAAALVSGVAAVALQAHPSLTPDQLKHALLATSRPAASDDPSAVGAGVVDAYRAAVDPPGGEANAGLGRSTGQGDLDASRGSLVMHADDPMSTLLTGRQTAQLLLWDPVGFTTGSWTPDTWYTSVHATAGWNTAQWASADPTGNNWTGNNWTGNNWTGSSWYDESVDESSYGRYGAGSGSYGAWK